MAQRDSTTRWIEFVFIGGEMPGPRQGHRRERLIDLVVIDVSFISVKKIIAPAIRATKPVAAFLILIKPQFELPREEIAPGGIVKDQTLRDRAIQSVRESLESTGLDCLGVRPSRLLGAEGNQEYFLHARKKSLE